MAPEPTEKDSPSIRRVGRRRVRSGPISKGVDEPGFQDRDDESKENDQRLRAEKPPHY